MVGGAKGACVMDGPCGGGKVRSPCQTCERAALDKNECALDCKLRQEYCKRLGIMAGPRLVGKPAVPNPPKPPSPGGMYSKGGRLEWATTCIKEGRGNRETCRLTGMSTTTAAKLRKVLEAENGAPFLCECGQPAVHRGSCPERTKRSLQLKERIFMAEKVSSFTTPPKINSSIKPSNT